MAILIGLEVLLGIAIFFVAVNVWSTAKAPAHLRHLLADRKELEQLMTYVKPKDAAEDAARLGTDTASFGRTLPIWQKAHMMSLSRARNMLLAAAAAILLATYFMGAYYFFINLALLLLPSLFPVPGPAKANNAKHVYSIVVCIMQWNKIDAKQCCTYFTQEVPIFKTLYEVVVAYSQPLPTQAT